MNYITQEHVAQVLETMGHNITTGCEHLKQQKGDVYTTGIPSGFYDLDIITSGFHKSELTILAARPSMGKTSLALNIALNVSIRNNTNVLYVSYEMNYKKIIERIFCMEAEVDAMRLRSSYMRPNEWKRLSECLENIHNVFEDNLNIISSCDLTFDYLSDEIKAFVSNNPDSLVIIDYFQLIPLRDKQDRFVELSHIASAFKRLAIETDAPIILVSQISRKCDERPDKKPTVADLSECDALAQHCDNIIFLYREEYYDKGNSEIRNKAKLFIDKHKNGSVGYVDLLFQGSTFRFKNPIKINYE